MVVYLWGTNKIEGTGGDISVLLGLDVQALQEPEICLVNKKQSRL